MSKVKIIMDRNKIKARVETAFETAMPELSMQILNDCNYYCRKDQGTLESSSLIHSDYNEGLLVWSTDYAKKVYFTGRASHDINSNASIMWCKVAKDMHSEEWAGIAQLLFTEGMRK